MVAMDKAQSLARAINEPIALSPYDPAWSTGFDAERERLTAICPGQLIAIEHIGSTAVPGMAAKPVIDLMGGVESMAVADALLEPLCDAGYITSAGFNAAIGERRWLMRWEEGRRTHHLHLLVPDSAEWRDRVAFRDLLRASEDLASQYLQLKVKLAAQHPSDREAYTDAKSEFIREVLHRCAT